MAHGLASLELLLLCALALSLSLLETPVPRGWARAAVALLCVQVAAMHKMGLERLEVEAPPSQALVHSVAEAVAVLAVPALTAALLTVIFFHCARAYARARVRLETALRAQAIGKDIPTGCGAAAGEGSCITGSSIGESATSPRAA